MRPCYRQLPRYLSFPRLVFSKGRNDVNLQITRAFNGESALGDVAFHLISAEQTALIIPHVRLFVSTASRYIYIYIYREEIFYLLARETLSRRMRV